MNRTAPETASTSTQLATAGRMTDAASATPAARYAVYWAPELDHPLWAAGCEWLDRDPTMPPPLHPPPQPAHRTAPALYGFHATLKAPITLADEASETDFIAAVTALAQQHAAFTMPRLQVAWLEHFLAIRPAETVDAQHPLRQLADACVRELDRFRRLPTAQELARRRGVGLDAAQDALLLRWGYPHVLDHWRFHLTLSDAFANNADGDAQHFAHEGLAHFKNALAEPLECRSVCIYRQALAGQPFQLTHRVRLSASA